MKFFILIIFASIKIYALMSDTDISPWGINKKSYMNIEILDQKVISFDNIEGKKFSEISDLTYDKKRNIFYMVSDEGYLFTLKVRFKNDKIVSLNPLSGAIIKRTKKRNFTRIQRDSEGVTLDSKNRLIISFESRPKIGIFNKNGILQRLYKLPHQLRYRKNLRHRNKSMEGVAYHPKYGIISANEYPIKTQDKKVQSLYSLRGKEWRFQMSNAKNSAITAIEVMDDDNILVLERAYSGLFEPFVITLRKVYIKNCKREKMCKTKVMAQFNSSNGWRVDNFEGLARISKNRYIIISDDNDNFYQDTIMIYFKIKE